jgi:hypothetical protein
LDFVIYARLSFGNYTVWWTYPIIVDAELSQALIRSKAFSASFLVFKIISELIFE